MTVHVFRDSLDLSHRYAKASWWREVYIEAFPTLKGMQSIRGDGWAQRAGVDRQLFLRDGTVIEVDEKVRATVYNDFFLEFWSDRDRQIPGWIEKELRIDYLAYAWAPSARCYLLPFPLLQRAWRRHRDGWKAAYGEKPVQNSNWVTVGCPVPISSVLSAVSNATVVHCSQPLQSSIEGRAA